MSFADAFPWAVAAVVFCVALVLVAGLVGLRMAIRDTSEEARPTIIRELGDYFRALTDAVFRWRRK
ncbi:hypothetical protein AB0E81_11115 [Streptomyces sp. NPDC033538]|uniref:hypothetical protein n=1 Tax=Streptomyces sp. NPDC033538 TaxID=3155367 RepID=UPI003403F2B9